MAAEIAVATTDCQAFDAELAQQSRPEHIKGERAASTAASASGHSAKRGAQQAGLAGPSKKRASLGLSQQRGDEPFRATNGGAYAQSHVEETQRVMESQREEEEAAAQEVLEAAGLGGLSQKELVDAMDDDGLDDDDEQLQRPIPLFLEPSQESAEDDEMIGESDGEGEGLMIPGSAQVSPDT